MKKRHIWLIGELGCMSIGLLLAVTTYYVCRPEIPWWGALVIAIIVYSASVMSGVNWLHRGTTPEERFLRGNDPY